MKFNPKNTFFIVGPCVAESKKICFEVASELIDIKNETGIQIIFKASYEKANRTSKKSYRGPGLKKGLDILYAVKNKFGLPVITDVHESIDVKDVSKIVDFIQIPAFLCRQTALLEEVAKTNLWINVKKGQFMAPWDIGNIIDKIKSLKNDKVLITERGTTFGYNNLVVDYRGIIIMQRNNIDVVFDATHSVQLPSVNGSSSGGDRTFALPLACAAASIGVKGFFFETHPDPDKALCDGPNSIFLKDLKKVINSILSIQSAL